MKSVLSLELPYPPTANTIWRYVKGKVLLSERGRLYRREVAMSVLGQLGRPQTIAQPVSLVIAVHPPDRRRRDIDNIFKATMDALTHAKVWTDDSLVKRIEIEMGEPTRGGKLSIVVASQ